jgi:hypothetical protein
MAFEKAKYMGGKKGGGKIDAVGDKGNKGIPGGGEKPGKWSASKPSGGPIDSVASKGNSK